MTTPFEEYVVRYTGPMVKKIKEHGGYVRIHAHGSVKDIIGHVVKMGADATGFELSLAQYLHTKINILLSVIPAPARGWSALGGKAGIQRKMQRPWIPNQVGNDIIKIKFQDFWNVNLSDANIVYLFLMQGVYPKLKTKFEKELKPGTKVIVYAWPIEGWTPIKIDQSSNSLPIYLYQR